MNNNQIVTFGCRLNIFESEIIKDQLKDSALNNAIIFNSCAVTSEAERQLRQAIRKAKKNEPEKEIIVTGCAAQINPEFYANLPEVDRVIGNQEKLKATSYKQQKDIQVSDIMQLEESATHLVGDFSGKARAYLEIQNGCNHRCTFCIIPYGRGNNRSSQISDIIANCQNILEKGYNEIVLTGVDITDYGFNLPDRPTLGKLVKEILAACPDLQRLRLSSLDVAEIDDELRELIVTEPRLLAHFHLSLQSGDDLILKRMKRRHNVEQIREFCKFVRNHRPDAAIGADLIAGFPTETDEMHQNTLDLVAELEIALLHVFPYSEREGTPAAKIPVERQVSKNIRKKRAKELRELATKNLAKYAKRFVGQELEVIIENKNFAKTKEFLPVIIDSHNFAAGTIAKIKITGYKEGNLIGGVNV